MNEAEAKVLGEAIGEAINKSNEKLIPQAAAMFAQLALSTRSGVYVEISSEEMATRLTARAKQIRALAEETASAPSREDPKRQYGRSFAHSFAHPNDEACERANADCLLRLENENKRARIAALTTDAERLDFMAAHVPKDQVFLLDAREMDDIFFGDRHAHVGATGIAGLY